MHVLPVEIVCFLLCHVNLVKLDNTWIMVATQQPDFAAALCVQSMFPVNIPVVYLSEDKAVPEAFVTDPRASVSSCDSLAPINWDRARDDKDDGFLVDCSGMRYVEQEEEAPSQEEEGVETQNRPPAKGEGGEGGVMAHQLRQKKNKAQCQWHSHTVHPPAFSKTCGQQGSECLCSPFYPLPTDTSIQCCCCCFQP